MPRYLTVLSILYGPDATVAPGTADAMIKWRCFDLEAQLYGGPLAPDRGRISVPQGFGLGLEPERDVIRAYAMV
jgi:L-alanine-DL-glutamate epimerase-like enolase superfamily enzyme